MADIVGQMTREMGLSRQQLDNIGQQQSIPQMPPQMQQQQRQFTPSMQQHMPSPEDQMRMMDALQQQEEEPLQHYEEEEESVSEMPTDEELYSMGLYGPSTSITDIVISYVKYPLLVFLVLFIVLLPSVDRVLRQSLPYLFTRGNYFNFVKSLVGVFFYLIGHMALR